MGNSRGRSGWRVVSAEEPGSVPIGAVHLEDGRTELTIGGYVWLMSAEERRRLAAALVSPFPAPACEEVRACGGLP